MKQVENFATAIYVHIPFCKARCGYCAFSSCTNFHLTTAYFDTLCREIELADLPTSTKITTMFWGGGTPTSVGVDCLAKLYNALVAKFDFSALQEFTVECNPESTTPQLLQFFKSIGVNRLSFGLQSANDDTLKAIGRLHNYAKFLEVLALARQLGFENINADLIVGLPESRGQFQNTLQKVSQLPLTHLSLYALEIHEGAPIEKLCKKFNYSDDDLAEMYDLAREIFAAKGFCRYEVSNFAKEGYACKHNLTYWTENRYYGFGAAAAGFLGNVRYANLFDIQQYIQSNAAKEYSEQISPQEEICEFVMLGLRLQQGFSLSQFESRFGNDFFRLFPAASNLVSRGFLEVCGDNLRLPDSKFYVLNSVLVELLPD